MTPPNPDRTPDDETGLEELTRNREAGRILLDLVGEAGPDVEDPRLLLIRRLNRTLAPWPGRRRTSQRSATGR